MKALIALSVLLASLNCKPKKSDSDTKAIVGIGEDGKLRSFALLPIINKLPVATKKGSSPGADYAIDTINDGTFYGLVECMEFNGESPEKWIEVVERRAAFGDLKLDETRRLVVSEFKAFLGDVPCRVIGKSLATVAELDRLFASMVENPAKVSKYQYLLGQTLYLSLRGPYRKGVAPEDSPLLSRYLEVLGDHFGGGYEDNSKMAKVLTTLDGDFNPCSSDRPTLGFTKERLAEKKVNYSCVKSSAGNFANYRPGSARGDNYLRVRSLIGAELARVHLTVLKSANRTPPSLHTLINLLTSTVDLTRVKRGTKYTGLGRFLAGERDSDFDFYDTFRNLRAPSAGANLVSGPMDEALILWESEVPSDFGLRTTTENQRRAASELLGAQEYGQAAELNLQRLLSMRTPKNLSTDQLTSLGQAAGLFRKADKKFEDAVKTLDKEFGNQRKKDSKLTLSKFLATVGKSDNAALKSAAKVFIDDRNNVSQRQSVAKSQFEKALDAKYKGQPGARLAASESFSTIGDQLETARFLEGVRTSGKTSIGNFSYRGEIKNGARPYLVVSKKVSVGGQERQQFSLIDKKTGATQIWSPLNSIKNTDAFDSKGKDTTFYQKKGSNRFQGVTSQTVDGKKKVSYQLAIQDPGDGKVRPMPTKPVDGQPNAIQIDFTKKAAVKNAVENLEQIQAKNRATFEKNLLTNPALKALQESDKTAFNKTLDDYFRASSAGKLQNGVVPNELLNKFENQELAKKIFEAKGDDGKPFIAQAKETYNQEFMADIGDTYTAQDRETLFGKENSLQTTNPDKLVAGSTNKDVQAEISADGPFGTGSFNEVIPPVEQPKAEVATETPPTNAQAPDPATTTGSGGATCTLESC